MSRSLLPFFAIALLFLSACSDAGGRAAIPGSWKVVDFHMDADELSPMLVNMAREMALSTSYTFAEDGTFEIRISDEFDTGTWTYLEEEQLLSLTYKDLEGTETHRIADLGPTAMNWLMDIEELGSIRQGLVKEQ